MVGPTPAPPSVVQAYGRALKEQTARRPHLAPARHAHVQPWRLPPVGAARHAWRGVPCTVAGPLVAALGDLPRVENPRPRMNSLGLIPSAYASGERRPQGAMPHAGHPHARRALLEGAWASRDPAPVSRHRQLRRQTLPTPIQDLRWPAHGRLCPRVRRLLARGPHAHQVGVAMARELAGLRWAMAKQGPVTP